MTCWLITGGSGFVGTNLVRLLRSQAPEIRVRILDLMKPKEPAIFQGTEFVRGDVRDRAAVHAATRDADVVVHLAANTGVIPSIQNPQGDFEVNALGTLHCLEAARLTGVRHFLLASSLAPLGDASPPLSEELPSRPMSPYGASKASAEAYCCAYSQSYQLKTTILRFSNLYGPHSGHKESVVARYLKQALAREKLVIYGDGSQGRDFLYVDDAARAIKAATDADGGLLHVATGVCTTVLQLLDLLRATPLVPPFSVEHRPARSGEVVSSFSRVSQAARINWHATVPLLEGLRTTAAWLAASGAGTEFSRAW